MHPLAIEMETKALELDPLNSTSHMDLGRAYALFNDWENALRYAKSAQSVRSFAGWRRGNWIIMLTSYIKLGRIDEAENLIAKIGDRNDDYYTEDYFTNLELNTLLAIAKGERDAALSQIEQMINISKWPRYATYGRLFLSLGEPEKAAYWFEKAIKNHDWGLISHPITNGLIIPENLPPNPVLQQTLDVPELNALFEIRRKNLVMSQ
jgi:tetratricopeptide (TPR) repeat protein